MKILTDREVEEQYGLSAEQLDRWEEDAANGILHGEPVGEVLRGRPLMFGEEMRQVGFKEPIGIVALIDLRAQQLGMRRSEYLRYLVEQDLKFAGLA